MIGAFSEKKVFFISNGIRRPFEKNGIMSQSIARPVIYFISMRRFDVIIITFAAFFVFVKPVAAAPTGAALLQSINQARNDADLQPLRNSFTLRRAAVGRAADMARFGYFSHQSATGVTYQSWLSAGPVHFNKTGENIAKNFSAPDKVVTAWLGSGRHRKNLLDSTFTHVGTAVRPMMVNGRIVYIYVSVFGRVGS